MTTSKTGFSSSLSDHFDRRKNEETEKLSGANVLYWEAVASAADGADGPTEDEATALAEAMEVLGPQYTVEGFENDVAELVRLRDLRARGDVEAAIQKKTELRAQWTKALDRVTEAKAKLIELEREAQGLGDQSLRVVGVATDARRLADELAGAMREAGAGCLEELAANIDCKSAFFMGSDRRSRRRRRR